MDPRTEFTNTLTQMKATSDNLKATTDAKTKESLVDELRQLQDNLNLQVETILEAEANGMDLNTMQNKAVAISKMFLHAPVAPQPTSSFLKDNLNMGEKCYNLNSTPVNGQKCLTLIEKCMQGEDKQGCAVAFADIDWASPIDMSNVDLKMGSKMLLGMNINYYAPNAVENWLNSLDSALKSKISANTNLVNYLKKLVDVLKNPNSSRKAEPMVVLKIGEIPPRPARYSGRVLLQRGGGHFNTSNTFTQLINSIKYSVNMIGGTYGISDTLNHTYGEFVNILRQHGKAVDSKDDQHIKSSIFALRNLEEKLNQVQTIINRFKQIHSSPKMRELLKADSNSELSLENVKALEDKYQVLQNGFSGKLDNLAQVLSFINESVLKFVSSK